MEEFEKKLIKDIVDPDWESFNLDIFNADETSPDKIVESLESSPLGSGNKLVIVKKAEVLFAKKDDEIAVFETLLVRKLLPTSTLVLSCNSLDKRRSIVKDLIKTAEVKEFDLPKPWEIAKKLFPWVEDHLRKFGKRIDQEGLHELVSATGGEKHKLEREIEKIILYIGEQNIIKSDDVRKLVSNDQSDVFEFLEYLGKREVDNALIQINKLIVKDNPIKVIATISSTFKSLYNQKLLAEDNMSNADIAKELSQRPFIVDKNLKLWRNYNSKELRSILKHLVDIDLKFKSVAVNHKLEFEKFIIRHFS